MFRLRKIDVFSTSFNIEKSKYEMIAKNNRKWRKTFFDFVGKICKSMEFGKFDWKLIFLWGLLKFMVKNHMKNKENMDSNEASF